jgi:hypothetical protein
VTRTRIAPTGLEPGDSKWEHQYQFALTTRGTISAEGLSEIRRCTDAAFKLIWAVDDAGPNDFIAGAIVGAVQSGKTGLMINLAARALDSGFRCILVLAGLRDDLRTQTAVRFYRDLLQKGDRIPENRGGGFTHPRGFGYHGARRDCWAPAVGDDVNHDEAFAHLFSTNLRRGHSTLTVAKKNVTTLNHLRAALEFAIGQTRGGRMPIMVIDDECDEASVSADDDAPTPERIAELWRDLKQPVAYIGFSATPAANLLQDPSSLLFPDRFVLAMRTPGEADTRLTYCEGRADNRYTGGFTYYQLLDRAQRRNFLVDTSMTNEEFADIPGHDQALEEALIAYFVSGAIRLFEQGMPSFDDPRHLPNAHTMLAHTESKIASHWELCTRIMRIVKRNAGVSDSSPGNLQKTRPKDRIGAESLKRWVAAEPGRWRKWHARFENSRNLLLEISPDRMRRAIPSWAELHSALDSVFEAVKLRVVNSDDTAVDDPLQFDVTYSSDGPRPPRDVYSIVIGGNRLSRGLTLEGLCISYYTRTAQKLIEDTTVQRERWFGYRGKHLEFCRVFTHSTLAIRLRRFHEHDEDLRRQLAWNIAEGRQPADATYRFLTIRDSAPTSKLGRGRGPLRVDVAGVRAFVDRVQMGREENERNVAEQNQTHAHEMSQRIHDYGRELRVDDTLLGHVLEGVSGNDVANLLDGFSYTFHNPNPARGIGWSLRDFYRPPSAALDVTDYVFPPSSDPYVIAAFLRYWARANDECGGNSGNNRYRAADGVSNWAPCPAPQFNVVVRYGSLKPEPPSPFGFQLLDRYVDAHGRLGSRWGGRRDGVGDEWIDIPAPPAESEASRRIGTPGLVLLHIIGRQAVGREGQGSPYLFDRPCVGIVVPEGGPCLEVVIADSPR